VEDGPPAGGDRRRGDSMDGDDILDLTATGLHPRAFFPPLVFIFIKILTPNISRISRRRPHGRSIGS